MRNLHVEDETCDLVVNLWTSFGFFSDEQNKSVLREFTRIVKPGGKILIHSDLNPERIRLGIFDEPPIRELKNGNTLFVYEYYCEENHSVYGTWKIGTDGRTHVYKIIVYSIRAWEEMAKYLGLTIEGIYGGLDERDGFLNDQSQEFVIVLAKNN
jgi:ubiquinone/menaquinone biosynthesis C-methylase UbiE